jgi:hypothetical protein
LHSSAGIPTLSALCTARRTVHALHSTPARAAARDRVRGRGVLCAGAGVRRGAGVRPRRRLAVMRVAQASNGISLEEPPAWCVSGPAARCCAPRPSATRAARAPDPRADRGRPGAHLARGCRNRADLLSPRRPRRVRGAVRPGSRATEMRALLVEDDDTLRHGLAAAMRAAGWQVDEAADGREGCISPRRRRRTSRWWTSACRHVRAWTSSRRCAPTSATCRC